MASFGENLRRERELRGIALQDIAEATKISVRFLQALEQDRLDVLPGGIFRRAFVRQYARYVGLDPEKVVAEFLYVHDEDVAGPAEDAAPAPGRPAAGAPRRRRTPPWGLMSILVLAVAGLAFVALRPADAPQTAAETPGTTPAVLPPSPSHSSDRVYPPPSTAPREDAPSQSAPAPQAAEGLVLTLNARETCWVAVQVDGQPAVDRVFHGGETATLEARGEIILSVGNAGGISFRLNDLPGISLGRTGEVRRNIVITRKSLPSLVREVEPARLSHSG